MKTKYVYHYPTPEELYALEANARRLRAQVVAELFRKAVSNVKGLFAHSPRIARHA
jgi:hypothetical protein